MDRDLKVSVCNSSAKTFATQMTVMDMLLSVVLVGAAGYAAYAFGGEVAVVRRVALAVLAAVCAYSAFTIVRVLVPFVIYLSFAHMWRLRPSFYLWLAALVVAVALCVAPRLSATIDVPTVQMTLILASAMLTVRFFLNGSLMRLALAFLCAGASVGLSALGVLAPLVTLFLLRYMANRVLTAPVVTSWDDKPNPAVADYFANPLVRSRAKWLFIGCYFLGSGLAFYYIYHVAGSFSAVRHAWLDCVGLNDVVFLLMTAVLPMVVGLAKVGSVSNVAERSDFGGLVVYMAIIPLTVVFLVRPDLFSLLAEHQVVIRPNVALLASVFYVYNMLLAGTIILADIRCRDFRGTTEGEGLRSDGLRNIMFLSYAVVSVAPLLLLAYAVLRFLL